MKLNFDRKEALKLIFYQSHYYVAWHPWTARFFDGEKELIELGIQYEKLGYVCPHYHPAGYGEGHVALIKIDDITAPLWLAVKAGLTPIHEDDFKVK